MTWAAIRTGMQTVIEPLGINVYDVAPALSAGPDSATVIPGEPFIEPTAHGGLDNVYFRVLVQSTRVAPAESQNALDLLIAGSGALSIRAAVEADTTKLGGTVESVQFLRVSNYGPSEKQAEVWEADIEFRATVVNA